MKRKYIVICLLALLLAISVTANYLLVARYNQLKGEKTVDFTIYPSSLPKNELWRIEHAAKIKQRAYSDAFDAISDEKAMLELVKHAWQWDKNAMFHYIDIKERKDIRGDKPDDMLYFDEFIQKYQGQFVDRYGNRLSEPGVFKHPDAWTYMRNSFAELKYPYASYRRAWSWGGSMYDSNNIAVPLDDECIENSLRYLNYAMDGGYREHQMLATWTLFAIQTDFIDKANTILIPLTGYRPSLSTEQLAAAIDHYETAAQHSALISIYRISEAYFYGIGRKQDWLNAYAWNLLLDYAYQELIRLDSPYNWSRIEGEIVMKNNAQLNERLRKSLTAEQQAQSQQRFEQLKSTITHWDHRSWVDGVDDFEPKP